jgi:hypothetical protein
MPTPKHIKILPELADYLDPLDPETFEQLKAQIARDGLTDPICYAKIELDGGGTVDAIIDGHHRYRACKEVGAAVRWRLIESVRTIAEAKAWMFQRQDGRRNWSPNRRAMYIAEAYENAKIDSGRRTDLHGGGKVDTALAIGRQFGVSDKTVTDAAKLFRAIERLTDSLGIDARKAMLSHTPPANRDTLIELAEAPDEQHRDVWQALLKRDTAGARALLGKAKRADQIKRPGLMGEASAAKPSAVDHYALPDLVRLLATKWSVERLEQWEPSYTEGDTLELHTEGALRSLIWLAERFGWGESALDEYRAAPDPEPESRGWRNAAEPFEPDAPLEPAPRPAASAGQDELRELVRQATAKHGQKAAFARTAGVNKSVVTYFLGGQRLEPATVAKFEAALTAA